MTDPYKVLGVSPNASDEEVKEAYRNLAKKYHPDQYAASPLKELADEKMKEINEAYDEVTKQRKAGASGGANGAGGYYTQGGSAYRGAGYNSVNDSDSSSFHDVRSYINANRIADAEQILNGVPADRRNAEWYFLKGSVLFRRGWLDEARKHFERAVQMEPGNAEYAAAYSQVMNQGRGAYGGYSPQGGNVGGCNACDMCSTLICADCCCECMGGDLIRCC